MAPIEIFYRLMGSGRQTGGKPGIQVFFGESENATWGLAAYRPRCRGWEASKISMSWRLNSEWRARDAAKVRWVPSVERGGYPAFWRGVRAAAERLRITMSTRRLRARPRAVRLAVRGCRSP